MALDFHNQITGPDAIHELMWIGSTDPASDVDNDVQPHQFWLDTTGGPTLETGALLKERNAGNTAWTVRGGTKRIDAGNSSTSLTLNWADGRQIQKVTLTGNCTFTFTAPGGPAVLVLELAQDATGSRTVTWPSGVHWAGGTAPTLTATASKVDVFTFYYNGTTYFGVTSGLNYTA